MKCIAVFTGKDLDRMKNEGGSGYWKIQEHMVKNAKYAFFIRNHRESWSCKDVDHGQVFMIGKISDCVSAEDDFPERKIIKISEYALLDNSDKFKKAWSALTGGQRYPISYLNTDKENEDVFKILDLDIETINWKKFEPKLDQSDFLIENKEISDTDLSEIILKAKDLISKGTGISIDKISIQINF